MLPAQIDEPFLGRSTDPRPKLFSRIAAEGGSFASDFDDVQRANFRRHMQAAEILWADDVVQSIWDRAEPDTGPWDEVSEVIPPYRRMWIEYGMPSMIDPTKLVRFGSLIVTDKYPTADSTGAAVIIPAQAIDATPALVGYGVTAYEIGTDGRMTKNVKTYLPDSYELWTEAQKTQWHDEQGFHVGIVLAVISMLHVKNVSTDQQPIDARHAKHCKRRFGQRDGGYMFRTVNVWNRPLREYLRDAKDAVNKGLMPLHKCRGGYAKYGPEFGKGLLFGKYSGKFFHPPHMRGNRKNGTIQKDYRLRDLQPA